MKLYVKSLDLNKKYTVDEITNKIFTISENPYSSNIKIFTYTDPEFKTTDCMEKKYFDNGFPKTSRARSVEDLRVIYNTYKPYTTTTEMLLSIEKFILKPKLASFIFCPSADKWVLYQNTWPSSFYNKYIYMFNYNSSNKKYDYKGSGEYTLREILNYLNISKNDRINAVKEQPVLNEFTINLNNISNSNNIENADNRFSVSV